MLRLGVVGTNWITDSFVEAALKTEKYQLTGVYSRSIEKAGEFGSKYSANNYYSDIKEFMNSKELDVIYIASPNSLHYEQCRLALEAGKHVIIEKPAFSNCLEMKEIKKVLKDSKVCLFEAVKHIHTANFRILQEKINEIGKIEGANFTYLKYSSRYDAVLKGEEPNIFSTKFSGGALADLGVYLIYTAVALFGIPKETFYFNQLIRTRVDGIGTIVFRYSDFDVVMQTGKIADSFLPSEIYGSKNTLIFSTVTDIDSIESYNRKTNQREQFANEKSDNNMKEEAAAFAEMIENMGDEHYKKKYEYYLELSGSVNTIMTELRKKVGIHYMADDNRLL